jgi:general secretion pathway protein D
VGRSFFSYPVRNTDASRLAETIQQLLSGASTRAATGAGAAAQTNSTGANPTISPISSSNVVVDKPTNTIMFRATGEEYTDIIRLLRELDRTARQVLIEVTVAKVSLGTTTEIGVDWIFSRLNKSGLNVTQLGGNTAGAGTLSLGSFTGLSVVQLDGAGAPRAVLNALATEDRATILATPRLLARNGEPADLQVGSQVPVLTSQQTSSATGGSGLISTVQYRDTGTILHIKPVIHSSDQVDIDITQEISSAKNNSAGGISSPTIDKTSLATKLTLKHGATYVLGGLISNEVSKSDSGVPFLKDIPLIGNAFKKKTLIVITPYIINDDGEARAMTEAIRNQLGKTAGESSTREAIPSTR